MYNRFISMGMRKTSNLVDVLCIPKVVLLDDSAVNDSIYFQSVCTDWVLQIGLSFRFPSKPKEAIFSESAPSGNPSHYPKLPLFIGIFSPNHLRFHLNFK